MIRSPGVVIEAAACAWRVDATFGVFGSLPLVGVTFDDAFVLLDSTSGALDGPFGLTSSLDATVLLAQHSAYAAGTTVRYVNASGCLVVAAPRPRSTPPLGGLRRPSSRALRLQAPMVAKATGQILLVQWTLRVIAVV